EAWCYLGGETQITEIACCEAVGISAKGSNNE
ncbi:MAG: hypothetical protein EZS28_034480, partial [Streblomastix strix]